MTDKTIQLNEEQFKKAAKKLQKNLLDKHSVNLKLSDSQVLLSQAFGYRNLFALQQVFTQETAGELPQIHTNLFDNLNAEQVLNILLNLMPQEDNMWKGRALSLMHAVLKILYNFKEDNSIILNVQAIETYLVLENLIKSSQNTKLHYSTRDAIRLYLRSMPDFQDILSQQNRTVKEQHIYLQMQLSPPLKMLSKIEKDDFIIADKSWFTLSNIAVSSSNIGYRQRDKESQEMILHPLIANIDFIEDSWLSIPQYIDWVSTLFLKNKLNTLKVSDLLHYTTTIISTQRKQEMVLLLRSILNNYSTASQISSKICKAIKE